MAQRQFTGPMIVFNGKASPLIQLPRNDRRIYEDTLQELLFQNPSLLPVGELEAEFEGLVAVARELGTPAGPIDLVFVNPLGFITLVETKLWRNPEARRTVVAQIVDYARAVSGWSYEDFVASVRTARKSNEADPLLQLFGDDPEFDQAQFIDRVSRNLRRGRFLLLIVGDGIREDVERMAEFLQQAPQHGFSLGLIELGIYRLDQAGDGTLLVQPRIVARTREITRAIIEVRGDVKPGDVTVSLPIEPALDEAGGRIARDDYLELVEKAAGSEASQAVRNLLEQATNHRLKVTWQTNGPALEYWHENSGERFPLVRFYHDHWSVGWKRPRLEKWQSMGIPPTIWASFAVAVASLVTGAQRSDLPSARGKESGSTEEGARSADMPIGSLVGNERQLFAQIDAVVAEVQKYLTAQRM